METSAAANTSVPFLSPAPADFRDLESAALPLESAPSTQQAPFLDASAPSMAALLPPGAMDGPPAFPQPAVFTPGDEPSIPPPPIDLMLEELGAHGRVGCQNACAQRWLGYMLSLLLQVAVLGCLTLFLLRHGEEEGKGFGWVALVCYCVYLLLAGVDSLNDALETEIQGLDAVTRLMDRPRHENPRYKWSVECFHLETVGVSNIGRYPRATKKRRVTYSASTTGEIPSIDQTLAFLPAVQAQHMQIDTAVSLDFSQSNYHSKFLEWCALQRRDIHQEYNRSEVLPSRPSSSWAVLVEGSRPWWLSQKYYWLANVFLSSACFRWRAQSLGYQKCTYRKQCFNI